MVLDMQPVAHLHAVAVDRQVAAVQRVDDEQWDQLFREVEGPVVVRAVRRGDIEPIGVMIGADQMVGRGLGRRVGRIGRVGRVLAEGGVVRPQRAIDLVGRDMMEAVGLSPGLTSAEPFPPRDLQQRVGADDVGVDEGVRAQDRAVDMAFCREVHDGADVARVEQAGDEAFVADVAHHQVRPLPVQVGAVAGIGEEVEDGDPVIRVGGGPVGDEVGADEAGAAGDEDRSHHLPSVGCVSALMASSASRSSVRQCAAGPVMAQLLPLSSTLIAGRRAGVG